MTIRCPKCQQPCGLFRRDCPHCGFALTVQSVWRLATQRLRQSTAIECANCRRGSLPFGTEVCPVCGTIPTFQDTVRAVCAPTCFRVRDYLEHVPPRTKWVVQWIYLLLSAAVLWASLGEVDQVTGGHWVGTAILSVFHLAAIGFFGVWLMPRRLLYAVSRYAPGKVKLALALNFFTGVLMLQLAIHSWPARTAMLAGIFGVVWCAARLLTGYVLPLAWLTREAFFGPVDGFDSAAPQGRSTRFD